MLKVENLSFSFGETPLYSGVNFVVGKGQKIGLVGPNGSGKSTLLNILTGQEEGYTGRVKVGGSMALVPQEVKYDPEMTKATTVKKYIDPDNVYKSFELLKLLSGLEFDLGLTAVPQKLSGGQKTKLALARALLSHSDILLLDEPTNFLDKAGKKWVMNFLTHYSGTVIIISHDLELMDKAIDRVLAINPTLHLIEEYKGNYTKFVRLKKERENYQKRQIIVKQKHIKQMEAGLSKMVRFTSAKGVRRRVMQQRRIAKEKLALPPMPVDLRTIKVKLPEPAKVGELLIRGTDLTKAYGNLQILKDLNYTHLRRERIAFIGPNGAGKSTLIKIIVGILEKDSGEISHNPGLKLGYYSQEFETFDFQKSVIETFISETHKDESFARALLGRYMFAGDKVFQKVASLSGGEKTRLSIALLTAKDNNLLVLDEPTTYLDVMSQRIILESLKDYKGAMIIVSHTPEFIYELAPQKAVLFPEGKTVLWDNELLESVEET